jgi:2-desacetyl-2-hydroxyethyl bacteriochlorophyllide A dehydrogenase
VSAGAGLMRAVVFEGPGAGGVRRVPVPAAGAGQVVVEVERAGICGTDLELLSGRMPYLEDGSARYPLRPGHEWSGRVTEVGAGVEGGWLGAHVTGDTMIGCGHCDRCRSGRHHVCAERFEIGIRGGWHGALAERVLVPEASLRRLPAEMAPGASALVEPAGNAWRTVAAAGLRPGDRVGIWGAGAIGLLCLQFARAAGAEVDVFEPRQASRALALSLGARAVFPPEQAGSGYDAVIDASTAPEVPARAVQQVEPGGRVVLVGLADTPALIDSRVAVLRDVTVTGILAASAGLDPAIAAFADGSVRPEAVIDRVVSLEELAELLFSGAPLVSTAPKLHADPRL